MVYMWYSIEMIYMPHEQASHISMNCCRILYEQSTSKNHTGRDTYFFRTLGYRSNPQTLIAPTICRECVDFNTVRILVHQILIVIQHQVMRMLASPSPLATYCSSNFWLESLGWRCTEVRVCSRIISKAFQIKIIHRSPCVRRVRSRQRWINTGFYFSQAADGRSTAESKAVLKVNTLPGFAPSVHHNNLRSPTRDMLQQYRLALQLLLIRIHGHLRSHPSSQVWTLFISPRDQPMKGQHVNSCLKLLESPFNMIQSCHAIPW